MTIDAEDKQTEAEDALCIIDLGEHSRKRVRRLKRGKGRLMEKVEDAIADLKHQGVLSADAQTLVVLVREEMSLSRMFDNDDDDDDD